MADVTITVSNGDFSAAVGIVTAGGVAPTPEIVPNVGSMNGVYVNATSTENFRLQSYGILSDFRAFYGSESLQIVGNNLDKITKVQLVFGGIYTYYGDGNSPWMPQDNYYNTYFDLEPAVVVSPEYAFAARLGHDPSIAFSVLNTNTIIIPSQSFVSSTWMMPTTLFESPAIDYIGSKNGDAGFNLTKLEDVWWVLRMWYGSGSHFILPHLFIRISAGLPPLPVFYSSFAGDLTTNSAYVANGQTFTYPNGPGELTNTGFISQYWRINSTTGGEYEITVREATDVPFNSHSVSPSPTFDSKLWLYTNNFISMYNDDAINAMNGWPSAPVDSLNGGSDAWSYLSTSLAPATNYFVEVSSYAPGAPFAYNLQLTKHSNDVDAIATLFELNHPVGSQFCNTVLTIVGSGLTSANAIGWLPLNADFGKTTQVLSTINTTVDYTSSFRIIDDGHIEFIVSSHDSTTRALYNAGDSGAMYFTLGTSDVIYAETTGALQILIPV